MAKFLATFKDYPPRQKAASFSLDEVLDKLQTGAGSKSLKKESTQGSSPKKMKEESMKGIK